MATRTVASLRESASRVLEGIELEQVVLHAASMRTPVRGVEPPYRTTAGLQVRADQIENGIESWARYVVTATSKASSDVAWEVEVELYALFAAKDDEPLPAHSVEDLNGFGLIIGAPVLHPFARDYVQSLTSASAFPAYTMGLLTPISSFPDSAEIDLDEDELTPHSNSDPAPADRAESPKSS